MRHIKVSTPSPPYVKIAKMYLHMKWIIALFTSGVYDMVYTGIWGVSEVFGAYVTCKIVYWQKESLCFLNDYFAKTCFYNGCRTRPRAKILTTFLIEAWCLSGLKNVIQWFKLIYCHCIINDKNDDSYKQIKSDNTTMITKQIFISYYTFN